MKIEIGKVYQVIGASPHSTAWGGGEDNKLLVMVNHKPIIVTELQENGDYAVVTFNFITSPTTKKLQMYINDAKKYFKLIKYNKLKII